MKTIQDVHTMKHLLIHSEVDYLYKEAALVPDNGVIINIGAYYGASAAALACGQKSGKLFVIDVFKYHNAGAPKMIPFKERTDVAWSDLPKEVITADISSYLNDSTELITLQTYSDDVVTKQLGMADLIFIDGDHTEHGCLLDALKYSQVLKTGGKLLFHDYTAFKSVRDAITKFLNIRTDFKFEAQTASIFTLKKI